MKDEQSNQTHEEQTLQTPNCPSLCHRKRYSKARYHQKDDLKQVCINKNDARFSQSSDTPFMQPPLSEDLGFLANTTAADQILQAHTPSL